MASEHENMNLQFSKFDLAMRCYANEPGILEKIEQNASFKNTFPVQDITSNKSTMRINKQQMKVRNKFEDYKAERESEYDLKMRIQLAIFNELKSKLKKEEDEPEKLPVPPRPLKKKKRTQNQTMTRPGSVNNQTSMRKPKSHKGSSKP